MVRIESLDQEGRGVAHEGGKVIFIDGALPGEIGDLRVLSQKAEVRAGADRPDPPRELSSASSRAAAHFGVCGGCSLQHLDPRAQVAVKQRVLEDDLWHIGKVRPETMLRADLRSVLGLPSPRAAVGARRAEEGRGARRLPREAQLVRRGHGFLRGRAGAHLRADLVPLRALVEGLSIKRELPQIELAVGDEVAMLVLRVLRAPSACGRSAAARLRGSARRPVLAAAEGPDSALPFHPRRRASPWLHVCPNSVCAIGFRPTDFTQVNHAVNRMLVRRAVALLDPASRRADRRSLLRTRQFHPAGRPCGAFVTGIDGNPELVARARDQRESQRPGRARGLPGG